MKEGGAADPRKVALEGGGTREREREREQGDSVYPEGTNQVLSVSLGR